MASPLTDSPTHGELQSLAAALASADLPAMFEFDSDRVQDFSAQAAGLALDYSKQLLSREARDALLALAASAELPARARALLSGEEVNNTERRAALHSLLRAIDAPPGLEDELAEVVMTRARMRDIALSLNAGEYEGFSGAPIIDA